LALNLQLSTKQARDELAQLNASLSTFAQKIEQAGRGGAFEQRLSRISAFKGIESSAINSLDSLARAMNFIGSAGNSVNNVSKFLNSLARIRVDAVAQNVERISKALGALRVPPTLDRFAATLSRIATASTQAATGLRQVGAAANSIKTPAGLNGLSNNLTRVSGSARTAGSSLTSLGSVGSTVSNTLAGFGIVLGAFGFAQFISSTYEAVRAMDRFRNAIAATAGPNDGAGLVGKELEFVQSIATKTATSIIALSQGYAKYAAAARLSGVATENIHKTFEAVAISARVMGLSAEEVKGSFEALAQMATKGRVSMEELRQQLGDRLVGSLQLMAEGLGYAKDQLNDFFKDVSQGKISSTAGIDALATKLLETYGKQLPAAMQTSTAAIGMFQLGMERLQIAFGEGFFNGFKDSLMQLGLTMNDPAFINGARAWGEAFGKAAAIVIQAVQWIVQNFTAIKIAAIGFLSLNIAGVVYGWVQSLAAAGMVASTVVRSVGGMVIAFQGLGFVSNLLIGIRAALFAAAGGGAALLATLGPLGIAMVALAFTLPLIIEAYNNWAEVSATLSDLNARMSTSFSDMVNWLLQLIPLPKMVVDALKEFTGAVLETLASLNPFAAAVTTLQKAFDFFFPPVERAASATRNAAAAAKDAGASAAAAAGGVNSLGRAFNSSASAAANAADAYREAASAAAAANGASRKGLSAYDRGEWEYPTFHAGSDVIAEEAKNYSGGGIAGKSNGRRKYSLPASAFVGAPHFAGGGVLGNNGIPAVLHPNEAVVPLAGGGTIPVQMMSGGQGSLLLLKPLQQLVEFAKGTKTEVSKVFEATTTQTVLMRNALGRIETLLFHIDNTRFPEVLSVLNALKSLGGTGGGSSGGGFSGGGYAGAGIEQKIAAQLDRQLAETRNTAAHASNTGFGNMTLIGGIAVAAGSKRYYELIAEQMAAKNEMLKAQIAAGMYSEQDLAKLLERVSRGGTANGFGQQFATGSPNASKDMKGGGFNAVLHPDEAVIPLPDGRSVPVSLPPSMMDNIERLISDGDARVMSAAREMVGSGGKMQAVNIQVSMTVNVKDADSFRASRDQIMRDLKTDLDRAMRTIGNRTDIDDPTKRA
jgi:tape measure domain-containing protein